MKVAIILAPYDSGAYQHGCGLGPESIVGSGLVDELTLHGHEVEVVDIGEIEEGGAREISTGFAVCTAIAHEVAVARDDGRFPVVLAGNCLTAAGAVAGEAADSIIWFDQHGDLNTPETSTSGFLDGMALAVVLGLCWEPIADAIPAFKPVDPSRCLLVDARDLDIEEKRVLKELTIVHASCADAGEKIEKLKKADARSAHLHVDLDVHDPDVLQANRYDAPGGPNPEQVRQAVCALARSIPIAGISVSAYNPALDASSEVPPAVGRLLVELLAALERI